ncbi:BON domain-containing protein [Paraburkholderia sp.]|uniref:BON domain-containing protein n=1 Tax=Paraburkholderia sp. TaxID=1926495 RepID=UPI00239DEB1B|nr:BON domain-containing protein [Paraburkholderia sp.]MDE1180333.1 BON domain-containing protein [Paraburkholderia sp.]
MKTWAIAGVLLVASAGVYAQQLAAGAGTGAAPASASASTAVERKNWFNDPFFAVSRDIAGCPVPLGPLMTKAQMDDDAHYRVERGTTCWLAHECSKPNSYLYDAPIADAIRAHFDAQHAFAGTSLWITIQRRFVYVEGCAPKAFDQAELHRQLEAIPDVEQIFIRITDDPHGGAGKPLPYKTLAAPD